MLEGFKQSWRQFKESPPGEHFQQHFERRQQFRRSFAAKALTIGGGVLIMAGGLLLLVTPGPGVLVLFIGAVLIAQESLLAARVLDWSELRLRLLAGWSLREWRNASVATRMLIVVCAVGLVVATGVGAYEILIAR